MDAREPGAEDRKPLFTATEWRAIFPAEPRQPWRLSGAPAIPASADADGSPLSLAAMLRALAPYPALCTSLRVQRAFGTFSRAFHPLAATGLVLALVVASLPWVFNDGRYGAAQFGTYAATMVAAFCGNFAISAVTSRRQGPAAENPLDTHGLAPVARWRMLVDAGETGPGSANPARSALVAHDPDDRACPCDGGGCCGAIPARVLWSWLLKNLATATFAFVCTGIFMLWSSIVTFGARTWTTPWSTAVAGATLILFAVGQYVAFNFSMFPETIPGFELVSRITDRAIKLQLTDLLQRYRAELAAADDADLPENLSRHEPYTRLHPWVVAAASERVAGLFHSQVWHSVSIASYVVYNSVYIATGSCITLGFLLAFLYSLLSLVHDLVVVAAGNAHLDSAAALYLAARTEALELSASAAARPGPRAGVLAAALARHADVLGAYARIADVGTRFLGFRVSYGAVRTLCVTGLTVAFGVWSVLRGAGVFVTVESVCPSG